MLTSALQSLQIGLPVVSSSLSLFESWWWWWWWISSHVLGRHDLLCRVERFQHSCFQHSTQGLHHIMPGRTGRHGPGPPVSKPRYRCFYKQPVEEEKAKQAKLPRRRHEKAKRAVQSNDKRRASESSSRKRRKNQKKLLRGLCLVVVLYVSSECCLELGFECCLELPSEFQRVLSRARVPTNVSSSTTPVSSTPVSPMRVRVRGKTNPEQAELHHARVQAPVSSTPVPSMQVRVRGKTDPEQAELDHARVQALLRAAQEPKPAQPKPPPSLTMRQQSSITQQFRRCCAKPKDHHADARGRGSIQATENQGGGGFLPSARQPFGSKSQSYRHGSVEPARRILLPAERKAAKAAASSSSKLVPSARPDAPEEPVTPPRKLRTRSEERAFWVEGPRLRAK